MVDLLSFCRGFGEVASALFLLYVMLSFLSGLVEANPHVGLPVPAKVHAEDVVVHYHLSHN
jgi:hypothetical protein